MNKKFSAIQIILLVGFLFRLVFVFLLAPYYFHSSNYFIGGDTSAWVNAFHNLAEHGTYSTSLTREYGFMGRMPGYSFIIGPLYYLSHQNLLTASKIMVGIQVLADTVAIYLVYKFITNIGYSFKAACLCALLYALYPFITIWNAVAHTEQLGVFFMLLSFVFLSSKEKRQFQFFFAGVFIGIAVLMRPQLLPLAGLMGLFLLYRSFADKLKWNSVRFFLPALIYFGGLTLSYGLWPIRNYVFHHKIALTQDLRGLPSWDVDLIAFMQFMYSIKTDWDPEFTQILKNEKVKFPVKNFSEQDIQKLDSAVVLAQTCSRAFSNWKNPEGKLVKIKTANDSCRDAIKNIFDEMRVKQIQLNPLDFYLLIPLQNLKKCLFKSSLSQNQQGILTILVSGMFAYRTILIFIGLLAFIFLFNTPARHPFMWLILIYFLSLYLILCFGTSGAMRNIEMRYLMPGDILLLFPAGVVITHWIKKILG